jgi:hypothetical protein
LLPAAAHELVDCPLWASKTRWQRLASALHQAL